MADGGGAKWLKAGCLTCGGLVLAAVLLMAGLAGAVWLGGDDPQVADRVLEQEVPPTAQPGAAVGSATAALGRVTLDLAAADFEVRVGEVGEPLRVEANFDENVFSMEEQFAVSDADAWHYTFRFRQKNPGLVGSLRQMFFGTDPDVRIYLPPDSPIVLDLELGKGGCDAQLGGLWLREADITAKMGGLNLEFDEPAREPMERLDIGVSMAGAALGSLGNASPRELTLDLSMGGAQVDLRGAWAGDSIINLTSRRSGGQLLLPRNVNLEGIDSGLFPGKRESEVPLHTLRFMADLDPDDWDVDF